MPTVHLRIDVSEGPVNRLTIQAASDMRPKPYISCHFVNSIGQGSGHGVRLFRGAQRISKVPRATSKQHPFASYSLYPFVVALPIWPVRLEAKKTRYTSVHGTTTRPRNVQVSLCHSLLQFFDTDASEDITRLPAIHFGIHCCHHVSHNTFAFVVRVRSFVCYVGLVENAWSIRDALPWLPSFCSPALKPGVHQHAMSVQCQ